MNSDLALLFLDWLDGPQGLFGGLFTPGNSSGFEEDKPRRPRAPKVAPGPHPFLANRSAKICWRAVRNLRDEIPYNESTSGKYACEKSSINSPNAYMDTSMSSSCKCKDKPFVATRSLHSTHISWQDHPRLEHNEVLGSPNVLQEDIHLC